MEVRVASHAGFCPGVRRAIRLAREGLKQGEPLYSLGPLVHNTPVVNQLEEEGLHPVAEAAAIPTGRVIIRAHGVGPEVIEDFTRRGILIIDATCPQVKKAQEQARALAAAGYRVIVVGDRDHPEVAGIVAWAGSGSLVVADAAEAELLPEMARVAVVAQTTQTVENYRLVVQVLRRKAKELVEADTICQATRQRQEAARRLAEEVDVMLIVGGAGSANTARLVEICRAAGTPAYRIDEAQELHPPWWAKASRVGVTAGASTPDWIIEEVVRRMCELDEKKEEQNPTAETVALEVLEGQQEEVTGGEGESQGCCSCCDCEEGSGAEAGQEAEVAAEPEAEAGEPLAQEDTGEAESQAAGMEAMVSSYTLRRGDIIKGTVVQINNGEVLVDVGGKSEGIIPLTELSHRRVEQPEEMVKVGDELDVFVIRPENEEGHPILSRRRADRKRGWERLEEAFSNGSEIQAEAIEVVKGGLLVDVGVRGFVPASLVERGYVEDLNGYVGKPLRLKVIELDRGKNKVVLSQKAVLEEEYQKNREQTWASLEEGQVLQGIVRRLTNFGAFVDLGGVDGLLHVSEISWGRVDHPRDALKEGQELEVKVLGVDRERERVSLGLKQLLPNPWDSAADRYPVGSVIQGKVLRLAPFGAFVEVEPGIEGLIHVSQLSDHRVEKPEDVVAVNDVIPVKVLSVDQLAQRMSLSLKEADPNYGSQPELKEPEPEPVADSGNVTIGDLFGGLFGEKSNES